MKGLLSRLTRPEVVLGLLTVAVLAVLVIAPLSGLVSTTLTPEGRVAWSDVLNSPISENIFFRPLRNSIVMGAATAIGATIIGGLLAWLVVMTDVPGRRALGGLAIIPFALPSFALALAWISVFRNDLIGGNAGILHNWGIPVPDWLAWGGVPVAVTLIAHYYSLSFILVAAALATVNGELQEAAEMTGASRWRVATRITLPVVTPALVSGALLAFAEGVSNFVTPAMLGLPVRFHTLSTRLYGAITTGEIARGYVLSLLLILIAAMVMASSTLVTGRRRSFATITGKGGRQRVISLGRSRLPLAALAWSIVACTTIVPGLVLIASSLTRRTNDFGSGLTLHYWIGQSDPDIAQGQRGILRNPQIMDAAQNSILLGLAVAIAGMVVGMAVGYLVSRVKSAPLLTGALNVLSYLPFLIPGIALGAAFIAQFGAPIGPIPSLYGTFTLLVMAGVASTLPFAVRASVSALGQVSKDVEEAAEVTGAGFLRRFTRILVPLTARGLFSGGVLVFVQMVRDLSLVVLLVTPALPLLATMTYSYSSENFMQMANAVTVVIAAISVGVTLLARRIEGTTQPWNRR